jgi:hypothetical protein
MEPAKPIRRSVQNGSRIEFQIEQCPKKALNSGAIDTYVPVVHVRRRSFMDQLISSVVIVIRYVD